MASVIRCECNVLRDERIIVKWVMWQVSAVKMAEECAY